MFMTFPHLLWLLLLAPVIAVAVYRAMRPDQRRLTTAVLCGASIASTVVALAKPVLRTNGRTPVIVAVIDLSPSAGQDVAAQTKALLTDLRQNAHGAIVKVVTYSNRAEAIDNEAALTDPSQLAELQNRLASPVWPGDPIDGGSATADALRLAGALIPIDGQGRIVLNTDGLATRGDAVAESRRLADRGIAVTINTITPAVGRKSLIRNVDLGTGVRVGQTLNAHVTLESIDAAEVTLVVTDGQNKLATLPISLKPGENQIDISIPFHRPGLVPLYFDLQRGEHPSVDGDLLAATEVSSRARVAVIQESDNETSLAALSAVLGKSAELHFVSAQSAADANALKNFDAIVLADLPVDQLSSTAQENIRRSVLDGTGLLVTGAARSFGPGGYADSALASMIPVRMPQQMVNQDPSTTLVLIIDTSGSMTGPRIALAKEIARLAIRRLQPHDNVGIVEFYGAKRWAAPVQSASNSMELNRALNRLDAGGGTVILPAIEEAGYALRNVNTRTRHILILTDGGVESGAFEQLARKLSDDGITISTVLCGPGQHSPFLANLAQWGRGRFYRAPDRFSLPEILLRQPQTFVPSPIVQSPTAVQLGGDLLAQPFSGTAFAPVSQFVPTPAKPTADVLLRTANDDALLARWQYGAGHVAALPMQLGSAGTAQLGSQPEFASLLSGLFRAIAKVPHADAPRLTPHLRPVGLEVSIEAPPRFSTANEPCDLTITDTAGSIVRTAHSQPNALGKWNELFTGLAPGAYRIHANVGGKSSREAIAVPTPHEFSSLVADTSLINAIQGFASLAEQNATRSNDTNGNALLNLQKPLAVLALVCLLLNVLARRWPTQQNTRAVAITGAGAKTAAMMVVVICIGLSGSQAIAQATRPTSQTVWIPNQPIEPQLQKALVEEGNATAILTAVKAAWANNPALAADVAKAAIENGDIGTALEAAKQRAQANPADAGLADELARLHELLGDVKSSEQQLRLAIAAETDEAIANRRRIRLALLLLDDGRTADAISLLEQAIAADKTGTLARQAAILANLYGQYDATVSFIDKSKTTEPTDAPTRFLSRLLEGNARLRTTEPAEATPAFQAALETAGHPRDRRYVFERIIAAARQSNALPALADKWLGDANLPADRLLPLATVLRELGRLDDLLQLWRREPSSNAHRDALLSSRMVNEVIGAALSARRGKDAEAICQELLNRNPNSEQWVTALARIRLDQGEAESADQLLNGQIIAASSPIKLASLARICQSLGRDELAIKAARRVTEFGPEQETTGLLIEVGILARQGKREDALSRLNRAAKTAQIDGKQVAAVADIMEQNGARTSAIELLRNWVKSSPNEDIMTRLAWLLEVEKQLPEALDIWATLYRQAIEPARKADARQRMLDLASRAGSISDLAADAEDRLLAGKGNLNDVSLLIDIYVGAKDPTSAAEVLYSYRDLIGSEADMLRQLATLYLRCERFGQADKALWQLVDAHPESAIDTLQELAVIALERKRPLDAQRALAEITRRNGETASAAELRAGILDHLNRPLDAAKEYRRAIADNPSQVESWLLWAAAMSKAKLKEQAIARLQALLIQIPDDRKNDDLFAVAIDGLLNLESPRPVLQAARRQLVLRTLANPQKLVFYEMIGDLSESLGDKAMVVRTVEASVPAGGEQRSEQLRQLLSAANNAGQADHALEIGRTLIALGDYFPPDVFLQLGKQLVEKNRVWEADAAFARAQESGDQDAIAQQVIAIYEGAGHFREALRFAHPLVARQPYDAALRVRLGGLLEQSGEDSKAFDAYLRSLELVLLREQGDGAAASPKRPPAVRRNPQAAGGVALVVGGRGQSVSESDQLLEPCIRGALTCARTPDTRAALIGKLSALAQEQIDSSKRLGAKQPSGALLLIADTLRRASFALGTPQAADEIDRQLLSTWPSHGPLRTVVVQARVDWGLLDRAAAFARLTGAELPAAVKVAAALAQPTTAVPATIRNVPPDWAALMLPQLIARDRLDEARQLLASANPDAPADPSQTIRVLVTAADLLKDQSAKTTWAERWVEQAIKSAPDRRMADIQAAMRVAWPHLPAERKAAFLDQISALAMESQETGGQLALSAMRLAATEGIVLANSDKIALQAVSAPYVSAITIVEVLRLAPIESRPQVLEKALKSPDGSRRLGILLDIVGRLDAPLDDTTRQSLVRQIEQCPPVSPDARGIVAGSLASPRWYMNSHQPELLRSVAETLLSRQKDNMAYGIGAAAAFATIGDVARADQIALPIIDQLRAQPPVPRATNINATRITHQPPEPRMLADAIALLSPPAREKLLSEILKKAEADRPAEPKALQCWGALTDFIILNGAGRREEAFNRLRIAANRWPDDAEIQRLLLNLLDTDFRYADFVDLYAGELAKAPTENAMLRGTANRIYTALNRTDEVQQYLPANFSNSANVQRWQEAYKTGNDARMLSAFRVVAFESRASGPPRKLRASAYSFLINRQQTALSGASAFLDRSNAVQSRPENPYQHVATRDWAFDELGAMLSSVDVTAPEVDWLADGVLAAANTSEKRQAVIQRLLSRQAESALTEIDRALLLGIGTRPEFDLPAQLVSELQASSISNPTPQTFAAIARGLIERKLADNDIAIQWAVAQDTADRSSAQPNAALNWLPSMGLANVAATRDDSSRDLAKVTDLLAIGQPKEAEATFNKLRLLGRLSVVDQSSPSLLWARIAAEQGDVESFRLRLRGALAAFVPTYSATQLADPREAFPAGKIEPDRAAALIRVAVEEIDRLAIQLPGSTNLTRQLVLVGFWSAANGYMAEAEAVLQKAAALADKQGLGEHQLWVADLAQRMEKTVQSMSIQRRLLDARALPPDRIVAFLKYLAGVDAAAAKKLADDAARYDADPQLQDLIRSMR